MCHPDVILFRSETPDGKQNVVNAIKKLNDEAQAAQRRERELQEAKKSML
jgi:hypothetical protein